MTDHRDHVLTMGADLAIGQSVAGECPFCLAPEKKFSVTRYADGLGYVCFRASCNARGVVAVTCRSVETRLTTQLAPPPFEPRRLPYTIEPLTGYGLERLGHFQTPFPYGAYSSGPDRIVFMLDDVAGRVRGWSSRTRDKKINSGKALPGPLYGYYGALPDYHMWIVEDCLSAIRLASEGRCAIALLGTHMADAIVDELWDAIPSCKRLYVALDPGAESAARKIVTRLRFHHGLDAIQVVLPDDIHRLDSETFQNIIEAYK